MRVTRRDDQKKEEKMKRNGRDGVDVDGCFSFISSDFIAK